MIFLPHTNTVILLEPYCGTITEPGLPVVQGEIMLISITIILLFNFEKKNISYVFLFLRNFKISFPQFLPFTLFCFREKNGEKTLQLTSINFVYMRLPDLRRTARMGVYINAKFAINLHYSYKKNFAIKSLCIFYKPRI